jgi:hypothetical protein
MDVLAHQPELLAKQQSHFTEAAGNHIPVGIGYD